MRLVLTFGKDREREGRRDRERKIKLLIKSSLILLLTFFYLPIQDLWGGPQDDRGVRWGDYLPPHRHINNSSEYGTNPTEQLLNARRPQTSKKCKPISLERGRTKDKDIKETKNFRTGLVGGVGLCPEGGKESRRRKCFHSLGNPPWAKGELLNLSMSCNSGDSEGETIASENLPKCQKFVSI